MDEVDEIKSANFRSLSSKFSRFTVLLFLWMVGLIILWDVRSHTFDAPKAILMCAIVVLLGGLISRFTMRALGRPLALLQQGITSVREGKFEPIQISSTHDEIQYLGESFNQMIAEINASQAEIRQHRDLLEERIRQRTEDLEKAMRAALAASQAKSEFLANMSHELRTPMNGLLGMLEVVLDSALSDEQREELAIAQRSAYALLALLNDILDLSKIEAGKMMIESIPYDVRTVLDDCVKSFHARAAQKKDRAALRNRHRRPVEGDRRSTPRAPDRGQSPIQRSQVHRTRMGVPPPILCRERQRTGPNEDRGQRHRGRHRIRQINGDL